MLQIKYVKYYSQKGLPMNLWPCLREGPEPPGCLGEDPGRNVIHDLNAAEPAFACFNYFFLLF